MASRRECPSARSWLMWSICRIEFFLTTPNSTRMPEHREDVQRLPNISSDISANGTVSGSASKIVIGCSQDSNCAARIRYMKMNASPNAMQKAPPVRLISLDWPNGDEAVLRAAASSPRPPSRAPRPPRPSRRPARCWPGTSPAAGARSGRSSTAPRRASGRPRRAAAPRPAASTARVSSASASGLAAVLPRRRAPGCRTRGPPSS